MITNGLSFDIEDWFQVENLRSACPYDRWDSFELRVERNTEKILELLGASEFKATFFILGWIAKRKPLLVKKIAAQGHEVASHGYNHDIVYTLTPKAFRNDLCTSKKLLEDISGQEVLGYRAPNFSITQESIWTIDIIKELGFLYDSSIFPTSFHDRYGYKDSATEPFKFANGLKELTLTTFKIGTLNLPLSGGGYFRLCPYMIFSYLLRIINQKNRSFIFYLHPWELDPEQPRVTIKPFYAFRHYTNLHTTEYKLNQLINDFVFAPLKTFL